jgi:phytanoyl-CoA hydroxylase
VKENHKQEKDMTMQTTTIHPLLKLPRLTQQQVERYHQEGYVLTGRIIDDATLEMLRREEARFRGTLGPGELTVFRNQLCHHSAVIREVATRGAHLDWVEQLVGPNVCLWFNQYVTKMPDAHSGKSEFPWHQDNGYSVIDPATNVTIWIALDDVDEQNGCVWVVPGSHQRGLLPHRAKNADSWHLSVTVEGDGVPARMKAGEAVVFSGLTLHRSKLNHTDRPRRAFFLEYTDAISTYSKNDGTRHPVAVGGHSWVVRGAIAWPSPLALPICR